MMTYKELSKNTALKLQYYPQEMPVKTFDHLLYMHHTFNALIILSSLNTNTQSQTNLI